MVRSKEFELCFRLPCPIRLVHRLRRRRGRDVLQRVIEGDDPASSRQPPGSWPAAEVWHHRAICPQVPYYFSSSFTVTSS